MLGTSSSESVLPRMMTKMENLGARKSVVGLVIPTGYSFNLDGTSIYLTMAAVFIAPATNLIGNGVATVVVAKWTGDLDTVRMQQVLNNETAQDADEPEEILDKVEAHMPPAA